MASGLTRATHEEHDRSEREHREHEFHVPASNDHLDKLVEQVVVEGASTANRNKAEHTEQEPDIAHAVHDECLVGGLAVLDILVPEADEQVGAEPHAFPAEEREKQAIGKHEHNHAEQEQVDVGEEAGKAAVAVHVTDGVQRDERADTRHEQEHDAGESVEQESDIHLEERNINPVAERLADAGDRHIRSEGSDTHERHRREQHGNRTHDTFGGALLVRRRSDGDAPEDDGSEQREKRNEP